MANRFQPMQVGGQAIPGTECQPGAQQNTEKTLHLLVLDQRPVVSAQGRDIEHEGQAAENHQHHGDPVHRGLRPFTQGLVRGGEAAGGDRRHGVVDGVEQAHAREPKRQATEQADTDVGRDHVLGHHV
ncbi:hypothetical protein D9M69_646990 [compost metagenome]